MAVVVQLCPSVCASSHFAVLLGAYGASLSILGECGNWGVGPGGVGQGAVAQERVGTRGGAWGCGAGCCDSGESGDQGVGTGGVGQGAVTQESVGIERWDLGVWGPNAMTWDLGPQGPGGVASGYGHWPLLPEVYGRPRGEPSGGFLN